MSWDYNYEEIRRREEEERRRREDDERRRRELAEHDRKVKEWYANKERERVEKQKYLAKQKELKERNKAQGELYAKAFEKSQTKAVNAYSPKASGLPRAGGVDSGPMYKPGGGAIPLPPGAAPIGQQLQKEDDHYKAGFGQSDVKGGLSKFVTGF